MKRWILPEPDGQALPGYGPLLSKILTARGIKTAEEADAFLKGPETLSDPFLMKDMDKAVQAIEAAVHEDKMIVVYGDYDCDGITSTVLLYQCLQRQGAQNLAYYIPDREEEGYGLNMEACAMMKENNAGLVITVDNGITAVEEIAYLNRLGIPVVVTDHHLPGEVLPDAAAVVDPHRADCPYPYKDLAGVGVAFKLICALEGDLDGISLLEEVGDLVCIGTVADVMPLTGENRTIVSIGLRKLSEGGCAGLAALTAAAGLTPPLTAESVAFGLGPRLNAASRLGRCDQSVELLFCETAEEAATLANDVDAANRERKKIEADILLEVRKELELHPEWQEDRMLVLAGEGWHRGVIGIAAARVVERTGKPCLLLSSAGEETRGSARSIPGFPITEALAGCAEWLEKYGGHSQAAGCSLKTENVDALRAALNEEARRICPVMPVPPLPVHAVLSPGDLDPASVAELQRLEPFGTGNERPNLLLPNCRIAEVTPIGGGKHLRLRLTLENGGAVTAVCFQMTPERLPFSVGASADFIVQAEISEYRGVPRLSLKIRDMRPAGFDQDAFFDDLRRFGDFLREEESDEDRDALCPSREETALVYRAVRSRQGIPDDPDAFFLRFCHGRLSSGKTRAALRVLREAGLVVSENGVLAAPPAAEKVDLNETETMKRLQKKAVSVG